MGDDMAEAAEAAVAAWAEDEEGKKLVQAILDRKLQGRRHHP